MFGVRTTRFPYVPQASGVKSSAQIQTTFGRSAGRRNNLPSIRASCGGYVVYTQLACPVSALTMAVSVPGSWYILRPFPRSNGSRAR